MRVRITAIVLVVLVSTVTVAAAARFDLDIDLIGERTAGEIWHQGDVVCWLAYGETYRTYSATMLFGELRIDLATLPDIRRVEIRIWPYDNTVAAMLTTWGLPVARETVEGVSGEVDIVLDPQGEPAELFHLHADAARLISVTIQYGAVVAESVSWGRVKSLFR